MPASLNVTLRETDHQIWAEELDDFVPARLFDTHTHIHDWRPDSRHVQSHSAPPPGAWAQYPLSTWDMLNAADALLLPGRKVHRISFGNPMQDCPVDQANAFLAGQVAADPDSAGIMLVRPDLSAEDVLETLNAHKLLGLKPYRTHSVTGDAVECSITDFLPEHQIEVADRRGLIVVLHLSKSKAIADPDNLADLERLTSKFPNVKWILAHCARSYYDGPLLKARARLSQLPNLWYDISSICDSDAMDVLLSIAGPNRVMYGSDDLPVGVTRGKYITFGFAWTELNESNHRFKLPHCNPDMTFVRYESLRCLRRACRRHDYTTAEIERIFYHNAADLISSVRG